MSLTFDFPGWNVGIGKQPEEETQNDPHTPTDWVADLEELSGDEEEAHTPQPAAVAAAVDGAAFPAKRLCSDIGPSSSSPHDQAAPCPPGSAAAMPDAVLQLVASQLNLADTAAMACCCTAWHEAITSSNDIWQQRRMELLGNGWPWPPFVGSSPAAVPASLCGSSELLRLKATLGLSKVSLRFFVMARGYEFLLEGLEALWQAGGPTAAAVAVGAAATSQQEQNPPPQGASAAAAAAATAGKGCTSVASPSNCPATSSTTSSRRVGHVDELWDDQHHNSSSALQVDERYSGRQLQRMVQKLAGHNWQLMYEGYGAAVTARADDIAHQLKTWWQQHQRQQQQLAEAAAAGGQPARCSLTAQWLARASCTAEQTAAAAAAGASDASTAALADCAGGILAAVEASAGGAAAGELLAAEPEVLLAATRRGPRPAAAISLVSVLLQVWGAFRRWLDLTVARCSLLGARVAAARAQLALSGTSAAAASTCAAAATAAATSVPHLRNKGLMIFRSEVLLAYPLRRPLQQAALWMAAAAAVDGDSWRSGRPGCGLSEEDLEVLLCVRKMLRELDVGDDGSEGAARHTQAKFRRCFGALLTRERRSRCPGVM